MQFPRISVISFGFEWLAKAWVMGLSDQLIDSFFLNGSFEDPLSRAIHHSIGILFSMRLSRVKGKTWWLVASRVTWKREKSSVRSARVRIVPNSTLISDERLSRGSTRYHEVTTLRPLQFFFFSPFKSLSLSRTANFSPPISPNFRKFIPRMMEGGRRRAMRLGYASPRSLSFVINRLICAPPTLFEVSRVLE